MMEVFNGYGMLLVVLIGLIPITGYVFYYMIHTKPRRKREQLAKKVARLLSRSGRVEIARANPIHESISEKETKSRIVTEERETNKGSDSGKRKRFLSFKGEEFESSEADAILVDKKTGEYIVLQSKVGKVKMLTEFQIYTFISKLDRKKLEDILLEIELKWEQQ